MVTNEPKSNNVKKLRTSSISIQIKKSTWESINLANQETSMSVILNLVVIIFELDLMGRRHITVLLDWVVLVKKYPLLLETVIS